MLGQDLAELLGARHELAVALHAGRRLHEAARAYAGVLAATAGDGGAGRWLRAGEPGVRDVELETKYLMGAAFHRGQVRPPPRRKYRQRYQKCYIKLIYD